MSGSQCRSIHPLDSQHAHLNDLKIPEFLNISIQPKTTEEWEMILSKFWEKYDSVSKHEQVSEFDVAFLFVLDYAYNNLSESVSAISRSVFAYHNRKILLDDRCTFVFCNRKCIFSEQLISFSDLYSYRNCEEMLVDLTLNSIVDGNLGLAYFLIKFGLVKFPYIAEGKLAKISKTYLIRAFYCFPVFVKAAIRLDELIDRMNENDVSFRSLLILFYVLILAEYEMHVRHDTIAQYINKMPFQNLECLNLYTKSFMETCIIYKDIETFIEMFLKPFLSAEYCKDLMDLAWILFGKKKGSYNPRSLKSLVRYTIRENLQRNASLPEQVNQLKIPEPLKEFLLFHKSEIWRDFKLYLLNRKSQRIDIDISELLARMYL